MHPPAIRPESEQLPLTLRIDSYDQQRPVGKRFRIRGVFQDQMFVAAQSAVMGGNVRVGLEDSLWLGRGTLAKTNAEQVTKIRRILEELGLSTATPDDAREMLKLKGGNNVGF